MRLSDFKALTFDCYGTLIDWEAGILNELKPWAKKHGLNYTDDQILETFAEVESAVEHDNPGMIYRDILAEVHRKLAAKWKIAADEKAAKDFGESVPRWPAFPDSAEALAYLKQHYTLVILSNVHNDGIAASAKKMGNPFHHIFTAEMIGSYKPSLRNFEYMIDKLKGLGLPKDKILHTAQSLFHDHKPAQEMGLTSAWIDRRAGKQGQGATKKLASQPKVQFRFTSLAEFAAAHKAEQKKG
ncbi:MAG: haloacid dehalogenase type II [Alphaproteobacteria bacterium]|nr:haloacid dehalogenase type II [Alphaproteobacteria bacterium]